MTASTLDRRAAKEDMKRDARARQEMIADVKGTSKLEEVTKDQIPLLDVQKLRKRLGLSQVKFAESFGFSVAAVRNWEQSRRVPDRATRLLLQLIAAEPELVKRMAAGQ